MFQYDVKLAIFDLLGLAYGVMFGFMMFHWQHEVNNAYWVPNTEYNEIEAGLLGSTYLLVPWYLKWSTLGIEYHHIHHLTTRIPSYKLQMCHEEAPYQYWESITVVDKKKSFCWII